MPFASRFAREATMMPCYLLEHTLLLAVHKHLVSNSPASALLGLVLQPPGRSCAMLATVTACPPTRLYILSWHLSYYGMAMRSNVGSCQARRHCVMAWWLHAIENIRIKLTSPLVKYYQSYCSNSLPLRSSILRMELRLICSGRSISIQSRSSIAHKPKMLERLDTCARRNPNPPPRYPL
jgi:hypothetical protein